MNDFPLALTLPGVTAWPGSVGKPAPTSSMPPMVGLSIAQVGWMMLAVPSILILLPGFALAKLAKRCRAQGVGVKKAGHLAAWPRDVGGRLVGCLQ